MKIGHHAGHGLTDESVAPLVEANLFEEYNIGHWIISESVFSGMGHCGSTSKAIIGEKLKEISNWKKAFESDLDYISIELREIISTPACIILNGPVGAGKTTFVQHFTRCMQEENTSEVNSPTYSIINEQGTIAHADFYRLKDSEEITHLELPLYAEKKKFFFIEWG